MKFSAQEEYGLRCLIALAKLGEGASITIPQIAQQENLTISHVAKLMAILRTAGLVNATRGQQGGYQLARKPKEMAVREILEPLGGRLYPQEGFCERFQGDECPHGSACDLKPLWGAIQVAVDSVTSRYTLQDLLDHQVVQHNVAFSRS